jgi:hypothetical protein
MTAGPANTRVEVAIAEPSVVLPAGVDDDLDRLFGDLLDQFLDRRRYRSAPHHRSLPQSRR